MTMVGGGIVMGKALKGLKISRKDQIMTMMTMKCLLSYLVQRLRKEEERGKEEEKREKVGELEE